LDPTIEKTKIYWRNKSDSLIVNFDVAGSLSKKDTSSIIIDDLTEGVYTFQFINYDTDGNASVETEVTGKVYGNTYQRGLLPRVVANSSYNISTNELAVYWGPPSSPDLAATKLSYTDDYGMENIIDIPREQDSTILNNYVLSNSFTYSSEFIPDSAAIDTFMSEQVTSYIKHIQLVNSGPDFDHEEWDGSRWGNLKGWLTNKTAKHRVSQHGN